MNKKGLFYCFVLLVSCTETIDFYIPNSEKKIIIDAVFTTHIRQQEVYIYYSTDYNDTLAPEKLSGATILLSDQENEYLFYEYSPGFYLSNQNLALKTDKDYTLLVEIDGELYQAQSKAKNIGAPIDSISIKVSIDTNLITQEIDTSLNLWMARQENTNPGDYYISKYFINNVLQSSVVREYTLFNDQLINGQYFYLPLHQLNINKLQFGDSLRLELYGVEKAYSDYLSNILLQTDFKGGLFDTPSANVKGNFSNGSLGFFSVSDVRTSSIRIE
jgi:hypothetical protein